MGQSQTISQLTSKEYCANYLLVQISLYKSNELNRPHVAYRCTCNMFAIPYTNMRSDVLSNIFALIYLVIYLQGVP